jgi:hypothetical protein
MPSIFADMVHAVQPVIKDTSLSLLWSGYSSSRFQVSRSMNLLTH